jgi:hypothetical protein
MMRILRNLPMGMLRTIARRARLPAGVLAVGGASLALYTRDAAAEYASVSEDELPLSYDPDAIGRVWERHPRCSLVRLGQIGGSTVPFAARLIGDLAADALRHRAIGDSPQAQQARSERHTKRAIELRLMLTELGPTFIKFGQMLSIRPDVIPPSAVYELQKLCDSVPSFPTPLAIEVLRAELGKDPTVRHTEPNQRRPVTLTLLRPSASLRALVGYSSDRERPPATTGRI